MNIFQVIAKMQGVLLWVKDNPAKAWQLFLFKACKPLWRYFYKRRIKREEEETNAIRLPLQTFREMVRNRFGEVVYVKVFSDEVAIIQVETEQEVLRLPLETKGSLQFVVWHNDLKPEV